MEDNIQEKARTNMEEFQRIIQDNVSRAGIDKLMAYLTGNSSDFFSAPASTRYHGSYAGGLCQHSLNVYYALKGAYAAKKDLYNLPEYSEETLAIAALFHDVCKLNCYKAGTRNVKDENGRWQQIPTYTFDDPLPYGHGDKSVYILSGFIRLTREEAFAIRFHMGAFKSDDVSNVGKVFEKYPLAYLLHTADMDATYLMEGIRSE